MLNYCSGGGGIDLVWDGSNGGRLKLAVNEWPDGDHPTSADYSMPPSPTGWPVWRYFAVSYDAQVPAGTDNVKWYFGNSKLSMLVTASITRAKFRTLSCLSRLETLGLNFAALTACCAARSTSLKSSLGLCLHRI